MINWTDRACPIPDNPIRLDTLAFEVPADAIHALQEELYNSAYAVNHTRIDAAMLYLCEWFRVDQQILDTENKIKHFLEN